MLENTEVMTKQKFKLGLKALGYNFASFSEKHAISRRTLYDWSGPPKWAEYWVRMELAEKKLREIQEVLDGRR